MSAKEVEGAGQGGVRRAGTATSAPSVACLPRLILWKKDLCLMLGVGLRTVERMISAGEIPAPDRRLRGRPAWLAKTIEGWAENGCPSIERTDH